MDNTPDILLTEADANPLNTAVEETTSDELVMQSILKAIASESGAICEYNQILTLIENSNSLPDKDKIKATIEDIKHEEEKHLEQLHECAKLFDGLKNGLEDGAKEFDEGEDNTTEEKADEQKEEVKESVLTESVEEKTPDNTRRFDSDTILDIILTNFDPTETTESAIYKLFEIDEELTAEEVDERLTQVQQLLNISPENMEKLEVLIIQSKDPVVDRVQEFQNDINDDIYSIKSLSDEVTTVAAKNRLIDVANQLSEIQYDGDKDTIWTLKYGNTENLQNKKIIS